MYRAGFISSNYIFNYTQYIFRNINVTGIYYISRLESVVYARMNGEQNWLLLYLGKKEVGGWWSDLLIMCCWTSLSPIYTWCDLVSDQPGLNWLMKCVSMIPIYWCGGERGIYIYSPILYASNTLQANGEYERWKRHRKPFWQQRTLLRSLLCWETGLID
jgi:hypothetical protein